MKLRVRRPHTALLRCSLPLFGLLLATQQGCATTTPALDAGPSLRTELLVSEGALSGLGSYAEAGESALSRHYTLALHQLRVNYTPLSGEAQSWQVEDPRWVRAEAGESAELASGIYFAGSGSLSLQLPGPGTLRVEEPDGAGWRALGSVQAELEASTADSEDALFQAARDVIGKLTPVNTTLAKKPVKVLFLPEGFTKADMSLFHFQAEKVVGVLNYTPEAGYPVGLVEGYRLDIQSKDSGIDDPKDKLRPLKDTAFDVSFGDDVHRPRRALVIGNGARVELRKYLSRIKAANNFDVIVVIAKTTEEAGACHGGTENEFADPKNPREVVITTSDRNAAVLAHELGHAILGLADEYAEPNIAGEACARLVEEGNRAWLRQAAAENVPYTRAQLAALLPLPANTATDLAQLPWASMLTTKQLPTRDVVANQNLIGAFEGAQYCQTGVYRAQADCMMRHSGKALCAVCKKRLADYLSKRGFAK